MWDDEGRPPLPRGPRAPRRAANSVRTVSLSSEGKGLDSLCVSLSLGEGQASDGAGVFQFARALEADAAEKQRQGGDGGGGGGGAAQEGQDAGASAQVCGSVGMAGIGGGAVFLAWLCALREW